MGGMRASGARPPAMWEAGQAWSPLGTTRRKEAAQSGADKPRHTGAVLLGGPGTVALVLSWAPGDLAVAYLVCRLVSGNSIEEKLLKNGTKDLIREVAAQGNDYSMAFLTQVPSSTMRPGAGGGVATHGDGSRAGVTVEGVAAGGVPRAEVSSSVVLIFVSADDPGAV